MKPSAQSAQAIPAPGASLPAAHCAHTVESGGVGAPKPASQGSQVARLRSASLSRWPFGQAQHWAGPRPANVLGTAMRASVVPFPAHTVAASQAVKSKGPETVTAVVSP